MEAPWLAPSYPRTAPLCLVCARRPRRRPARGRRSPNCLRLSRIRKHQLVAAVAQDTVGTSVRKFSLRDDVIQHGLVKIIRVLPGHLGLCTQNGKPVLLLAGRHLVNDALFQYVGDKVVSARRCTRAVRERANKMLRWMRCRYVRVVPPHTCLPSPGPRSMSRTHCYSSRTCTFRSRRRTSSRCRVTRSVRHKIFRGLGGWSRAPEFDCRML